MAEFEFNPEKHIKLGDAVYLQEEIPAPAAQEIAMINWIDQELASQTARLKLGEDGRAMAIARLMAAMEEVKPVHVEAEEAEKK